MGRGIIMCDHCVKRERAVTQLDDDQKHAVSEYMMQTNRQLNEIALVNGEQSEEFLNAYLAAGDGLDVLLGISEPTVPDFLPDEWSDDPEGGPDF